MALTLAQLLAPLTTDQTRQIVLSVLQGVGQVTKSGPGGGASAVGTGALTLSGTPAGSVFLGSPTVVPVSILITTTGEIGAGAFEYSTNGGVSYSAPQTITATFLIPNTGITITFIAGPAGAGTSFVVNDTFAFNLSLPSFPVTAWQVCGVAPTLAEVDAQTLAEFTTTIANIASGGFVSLATASWLDLNASNLYGLTRIPSAAARGTVTLTNATGAGPYTFTAGQFFFATAGGLRFSNTSTGTVPLSASLAGVAVVAEQPGSAYNVADNSITVINSGVLAGLSVNNPGPGSISGGADPETDAALSLRCQNRWPTVGIGATAATYQFWAASAEAAAGHSVTITKSLVVTDAAIAGQVNVFLATATGVPAGQAVTDANTYIQARLPLPSTAVVAAASA